MNTINARQIKQLDGFFRMKDDMLIGDCIGHLLQLIYDWAKDNNYKIINTTSFKCESGFDICILYEAN